MIQRFLESPEHMNTFIEKLAELGSKSGERTPSSVEPKVHGEMYAFGATAGAAESVMGHGWEYREMKDPTVEVMQWQMATLMTGLEEQVRDLMQEGEISEQIGEYLLTSLSSSDITSTLDSLGDTGSETLSRRAGRVSSDTASIPESVVALLNHNKALLAELVKFAQMLVDKSPEDAAKLEGIINTGRDLALGDGL